MAGRASVPTVSLGADSLRGQCGLLQVWHWEGCPNSFDMGSAVWVEGPPTCLLSAARPRLDEIPEPLNV